MDLLSYIHKGGVIVDILIVLNIVGFSIIFYKLITLVFSKKSYSNAIENILEDLSGKENKNIIVENAISHEVQKFESGLNTIKIIALVSPLLGLLGTVVGVLNAFENITAKGLGDPAIFSGGISVALITTVAGLIVAIPHYVGYNYFIGVVDNLELKIKKEVLEKIEKKVLEKI